MTSIDHIKKGVKITKKTTLRTEERQTVKSLLITLALMIITLAGAFLGLTSQNAQKGYALQQEKLKNEYLENMNSSITIKINESKSFTEINSKFDTTRMEELDSELKTYVTNEDNSLEKPDTEETNKQVN